MTSMFIFTVTHWPEVAEVQAAKGAERRSNPNTQAPDAHANGEERRVPSTSHYTLVVAPATQVFWV